MGHIERRIETAQAVISEIVRLIERGFGAYQRDRAGARDSEQRHEFPKREERVTNW
jgi:hypothetical protein